MDLSKLVLLTFALFSSAANSSEPIRVVIEHGCSRPGVLSVSIRNESPAPVEFERGLLPWYDATRTLRIEAFTVGNGRAKRLPAQAAVSDHLARVTLLPAGALRGEISLPRIFGDFGSAHKSSDIVVRYRVLPVRRNGVILFHGESGILIVPRSGFFSDECPTLVPG